MNSTTHNSDKKKPWTIRKGRHAWKNRLQGILDRIKPHASYYGALTAAVIIIYSLIRPPSAIDLSRFQLDRPSPRVIQAPFEFDYVDEEATEAERLKQEEYEPPVYNRLQEKSEQMHQHLQTIVDRFRKTPRKDNEDLETWIRSMLDGTGVALENSIYNPERELPEDIPRTTYDSLLFYRQFETLWNIILTSAKEAEGLGIADNAAPLRKEEFYSNNLAVGVELIDAQGNRSISPAVLEIRTQQEFFDKYRQKIEAAFPDENKDYAARELAIDLIHCVYTGHSLIFNKKETEAKREAARNRVGDVVNHVNKEDTLIGKNDIVTSKHLQKLQALHNRIRISLYSEIGYFIMAFLLVLLVLKYLKIYNRDIAEDARKVFVIFAGMILVLILARIVGQLSLLDMGSNTLKQVGYAVPVGALGVIVTLLACPRLAAFLCVFCSLYMGVIFAGGSDFQSLNYVIVAIVTSCGAIYAVSRIRQRSDLYRAGGMAMLLANLMILAISLQQHKTFEQFILHAHEVKYSLIWGAVNGGLISVLSMALLPLFEDFFGVTTDMKLLELSHKNELMQRLEQEAPGSYQHSMRVATLAESAAESIGANALLTRVGCYYHDIGKMVKPQYFVENQQTRADKAKHEKIKPTMSCFIIRSHVKHGMELAEEYHLPQVIRHFIPEHHGTTLMTYFYHQALAAQETEGAVKEEDYRYPGPKPQSKETAIVMLADALEAVSRTLKNPSEGEVRQLVRKMINDRYMDEQFDECDLTLRDLHKLFLAFSDSIIHMLHQRIEYPEAPKPKEKTEEKELPKEEPLAAAAVSAKPEEKKENGEKTKLEKSAV
ncbi:MAG: HDIG domain-containing metalloprotein [Candidatus Omnitrophota bacterium]